MNDFDRMPLLGASANMHRLVSQCLSFCMSERKNLGDVRRIFMTFYILRSLWKFVETFQFRLNLDEITVTSYVNKYKYFRTGLGCTCVKSWIEKMYQIEAADQD